MDEVIVYNKNLEIIGDVENYTSLIWTNRYWDTGDCELYVAASAEYLDMLRRDYYIKRPDDDMICRIVKIELTTNADEGNYLIVTGVDSKALLDQRIIWSTTTAQGNAETFARRLVYDALIAPLIDGRMAEKPNGGMLVVLDTAVGLTEDSTEQVSYVNLGKKMREICQRLGWGYRMQLDSTQLKFGVYKGTDRSSSVIFSPDNDNLLSSDYTVDGSKIRNVAMVGGSGEGALRICEPAGTATSTDRYEVFIDARNTSNVITYGELTDAYPLVADGGYGSIVNNGSGYYYQMSRFDVQIFDENMRLRISNKYPGGVYFCGLNGSCWYRLTNVNIAKLESGSPDEYDSVTLEYIAYSPRLVSLGYDEIDGYDLKVKFVGEIDPLTTFVYKTDYFLGDVVKIENDFGISSNARIVEVAEVNDANGYRVVPKFEYES